MASRIYPLFAFSFALAVAGCGDDGTGDPSADTTAGPGSSGSADGGPGPGTDTGSTAPGDADASGTTMVADGTTVQTGESSDGGTDGSGSDGSGSDTGASSSSSDDGASSSSEGGMGLPECEVCEDDEVCVANQAFATTYECQPMPKACEDDVDCECGSSLCVEPYVGCFDPPEASTLFCACIAC
jgi:hypothetical protein